MAGQRSPRHFIVIPLERDHTDTCFLSGHTNASRNRRWALTLPAYILRA